MKVDRHALRFQLALVAGVLVVVALIVFRGRRSASLGEASIELPAAEWCPAPLAPIAGGGCFAAPRGGKGALLVYLHGLHSPENVGEERKRQTRVAERATARGFAVLALRGHRGECAGAQMAEYWCWPSNERNVGDGPSFVAEWQPAIAAARKRASSERTVLLGFSNGGYFATMIATRALHPFDAVAIAHAGPVEPTRAAGKKPPILLLTADDDPSNDEMLRLDAKLTEAAWPHEFAARGGDHDLPDWDVDIALAFFARTERERLPLSPPLSARAPVRKPPAVASAPAPDAGSAPSVATAASLTTAAPSAATTEAPAPAASAETPP